MNSCHKLSIVDFFKRKYTTFNVDTDNDKFLNVGLTYLAFFGSILACK